MSDYAFNYSFNITGNASTAAQQITGDVTALNNTVKQATGIWDSFAGKVVAFNQLSQFVEGFSRTVDETLAPGAALNASLADLSAISGETGESLKTIERYARDAAKTFGGSAAQSVESYKLLLSQLSPELAKTPDALKAMGDNIAVLSKTMGGDAKAAAEVLTTAMNQYGVSLADPMEASRKMAQMMNVMAAAGRRVPPSCRRSKSRSSNAVWLQRRRAYRSRRRMPRYRYSTKRAKREPRAVSPCETSCRYSPPGAFCRKTCRRSSRRRVWI